MNDTKNSIVKLTSQEQSRLMDSLYALYCESESSNSDVSAAVIKPVSTDDTIVKSNYKHVATSTHVSNDIVAKSSDDNNDTKTCVTCVVSNDPASKSNNILDMNPLSRGVLLEPKNFTLLLQPKNDTLK